jgi:hypothetical protein
MSVGGLTLIALVIGAVVVLGLVVWQGARLLARVRRVGRVGSGLARMGRELESELDLVVRRVDAVRREEITAGEIIALVSQAVDEVGEANRTVKSLPVAPERAATRDAFELELLHAARALEAILDACLELEGSTQAERRERALTTLKWGHVNLVRAHTNLAEQVQVLDGLGQAGDSGWRTSRI